MCIRDRRVSEHDERVFEVELSCPDDALAIGALSSATFMTVSYTHLDVYKRQPLAVGFALSSLGAREELLNGVGNLLGLSLIHI